MFSSDSRSCSSSVACSLIEQSGRLNTARKSSSRSISRTFSLSRTLSQLSPQQCLQITVHIRPAFLQPQFLLHLTRQEQKMVLRSSSGAGFFKVITGSSPLKVLFHTQSVGSGYTPRQFCTCRYVRSMCCSAADEVGGRLVRLPLFFAADFLKSLALTISISLSFTFPPNSLIRTAWPVQISEDKFTSSRVKMSKESARVLSFSRVEMSHVLPTPNIAEVVSQPENT